MIVIEWGKYTAECSTLIDAQERIKKLNINLQEATIKFRCMIPGIAFEEIVKDVQGSGGKIL